MTMGLTMMNAAKWLSEAILSMIVAAILFTLFIAHERRGRCRALDLSIFRNLQLTGGIIAQSLYSMGSDASLILIVIFLEALGNYSASLTALLITPFELSFLVFGVMGGRISDKKRVRDADHNRATTRRREPAHAIWEKCRDKSSLHDRRDNNPRHRRGLFIAPNTSSIMTSIPPERRADRLSNKNILLQHRIPDKPKHSSNITCPSNFI